MHGGVYFGILMGVCERERGVGCLVEMVRERERESMKSSNFLGKARVSEENEYKIEVFLVS